MTTPIDNTPPVPGFYTLFPVTLLALSLAAVMGWLVIQGVREYRGMMEMADQQRQLAARSADAEMRLQAMVLDLLALAETNADAAAIVERYAISYTPPAATP